MIDIISSAIAAMSVSIWNSLPPEIGLPSLGSGLNPSQPLNMLPSTRLDDNWKNAKPFFLPSFQEMGDFFTEDKF